MLVVDKHSQVADMRILVEEEVEGMHILVVDRHSLLVVVDRHILVVVVAEGERSQVVVDMHSLVAQVGLCNPACIFKNNAQK